MMKKQLLFLSILPSLCCSAPSWVEKPEFKRDAFSSIGLGDTLNEAKRDALVNLSNTMSSSISSSLTHSITTQSGETLQKSNADSQIISDIVMLPRINWDKMELDEGIYYVQASIFISQYVMLIENHIELTLAPLKHLLNKSSLSLEDYFYLEGLSDKLSLLSRQALSILTFSPNSKGTIEDIHALLKMKNAFKQTICIKIIAKSTSDYEKKILQSSLEQTLAQSGLPVKNNFDCLPLTFYSSSQSEQVKKKRRVHISMQVELGQPTLYKKLFKFSGDSQGKKSIAMANASANFASYFSRENSLLNTLFDNSLTVIEISTHPEYSK